MGPEDRGTAGLAEVSRRAGPRIGGARWARVGYPGPLTFHLLRKDPAAAMGYQGQQPIIPPQVTLEAGAGSEAKSPQDAFTCNRGQLTCTGSCVSTKERSPGGKVVP